LIRWCGNSARDQVVGDGFHLGSEEVADTPDDGRLVRREQVLERVKVSNEHVRYLPAGGRT